MSRPKHQLDFYQAMKDFQLMFPELDTEVIEAVLRDNNGGVDATIDQLLTLNGKRDAKSSSKARKWSTSSSSSESLPPYAPPPYSPPAAAKPASKPNRYWNPPLLGTLPVDFLRLAACKEESPVRGESSPATRSKRSGSSAQSSVLLQSLVRLSVDEQLRQNRHRRSQVNEENDPELAQYLDDEKLAILLQNEEFLTELRQNDDFMATLKRDQKRDFSVHSTSTPMRAAPPELSTSSSSSDDNSPRQRPRTPESSSDDTLDTPEQATPPPRHQTDEDFRSQLTKMGSTSRRKFAALARLFSRREKKKKPMRFSLKEHVPSPSTMNLLDDNDDAELTDDEELELRRQRADGKIVVEPLPGSLLSGSGVPTYRIVQRGSCPVAAAAATHNSSNIC